MIRCVNIDWLEVYAMENVTSYPMDADFFRANGWNVRERPYGTRVYKQMFTLLDEHDNSMIEIRREPFSSNEIFHGLFFREACHIRLTNRACYLDNAVAFLRDFLAHYHYTLMRIYRIDICMDFETFDFGDKPKAFLQRYMQGRYSKINQANISAHGRDQWDGRDWNSLSWGNPKSMVSTKFYNKTLELQQAHDKPYIRYAWFRAGLIDDFQSMTRRDRDGSLYSPQIWRVEFAIKSPAARWFLIENENGRKMRRESHPHGFACYDTREKLITAFASLQHHYFHFKKYEEGQRKDRCPDKQLFRFSPRDTAFQIDRLPVDRPKSTKTQRFLNAVLRFQQETHSPEVVRSCQIIIDFIRRSQLVDEMGAPFDGAFIRALQQTMADRIKGKTPSQDILQLTEYIAELGTLF